MNIIDRARELRRKIEENAGVLSDEDALGYMELYPTWLGDGVVYTAGQRVRYNDALYRVLQSHISQEGWNPCDAPSLFAKVLIVDSSDIPEWEQPISTNGYVIGDRVVFEGMVYESTIDNNVWSPADYPSGWTVVGEA